MLKNTISIDPNVVMYTHSRIRPIFTGCGGRLEDTLLDIVENRLRVEDLPPITVIENEGNYFSLNNRRLYVLRQLRSQGLLTNNSVQVHLKPALEREKKKYTPENCVMEAKIMIEHSWENVNETSAEPSTTTSTPVVAPARLVIPLTMRNCKIDDSVLRSLKDLKKLLEKGKKKAVASQLDEWVMNGLLSDAQLVFVNSELGI
jgi:hypothetical protein